MERIIFYILAFVILFFSIASVSSYKMLRSVVYLLFVLIGISGIYFLIDYNFLAAIQLTIYAGGVVILMVFSVFLIHNIEMEKEKKEKKIAVATICVLGLALFLKIIYSYNFKTIENTKTTTVTEIGTELLNYEKGGFVLPFEVVSILLLAVLVGSIIIGKGNKLDQ